MNDTLIIIGILATGTVALLVYGIYQAATRRKTILADRVEAYTSLEEEAAIAADAELHQASPVARFMNMLLGRGYIESLERDLAGADIPMRPAEYILLRFVLAGLGFLLGQYFFGFLHSGLALALFGFFVPALFVKFHESRRKTKFVRQLADALMLLTNSLRSGYSFLKGLELVAKEMDDPISKELGRMLREVSLGAKVEDALLNMGKRVNSADLDIVISAYLVQKDVGGNLTEIMDTVAATIRERLKIQGDIRVLTVQGKLSGMVVGFLPLGLFLFFLLKMPDYFKIMFEPPMVSFFGGFELPLGAVILLAALTLQLIGGFVIYKIISIKI